VKFVVRNFLLTYLFKTAVSPQNEAELLTEVKSAQNLLANYAFTKDQHFGFEAAAWYWHFVDVVWIFLFITIYWWGS